MENNQDRVVIWSEESNKDMLYPTRWYKVPKLQQFVRKLIRTEDIVGIAFEKNRIGFITRGVQKPFKIRVKADDRASKTFRQMNQKTKWAEMKKGFKKFFKHSPLPKLRRKF